MSEQNVWTQIKMLFSVQKRYRKSSPSTIMFIFETAIHLKKQKNTKQIGKQNKQNFNISKQNHNRKKNNIK